MTPVLHCVIWRHLVIELLLLNRMNRRKIPIQQERRDTRPELGTLSSLNMSVCRARRRRSGERGCATSCAARVQVSVQVAVQVLVAVEVHVASAADCRNVIGVLVEECGNASERAGSTSEHHRLCTVVATTSPPALVSCTLVVSRQRPVSVRLERKRLSTRYWYRVCGAGCVPGP